MSVGTQARKEARDVHEFALFDVGSQRLGVPSHYVVQAIASPTQLTQVPRARHALAGVFVHRGQVVPLLDLGRWMAQQAGAQAAAQARADGPRQVLILQADEKVFAVLIDALHGLLRVAAGDARRIHHDADALEFFHSVVLAPDQQTLITLLDPVRLAVQAQVWAAGTQVAPAPPAQGGQGPLADGGRALAETCAVVRLGATLLALPAAAVGEVVRHGGVKRMPGLGRDFLGMAQWRGQDVPVLDMACMLGLPDVPDVPASPLPWLLVLHWQGRLLAFPVHEICAVRAFEASAWQASQGVPPTLQAFCQGTCLMPDGTRVFALQAQALLDASPLSQRAAVATAQPSTGPLRLAFQPEARSGALVVFKSRQLWAAGMDLMREIVPLPADLPPAPEAANAQLGAMEWRGQAIAVWDLRMTLDGQASGRSADARVIVLQAGARTLGLLVESVLALVPGQDAARHRFSAHGSLVDMVTVGSGASQVSYQLMDLASLQPLQGTPQRHSQESAGRRFSKAS